MTTQRDIFTLEKKEVEQFLETKKQTHQILSHIETPLIVVRSFFPLDLFPDYLSINTIEITFVHYIFFFSYNKTTLPVTDIGDISLNCGPFFASLKIFPTMTIQDDPIIIRWLTLGEAKKAHDILQGLLTLKKQRVDISHIPAQDTSEIEEIRKIGKAYREG